MLNGWDEAIDNMISFPSRDNTHTHTQKTKQIKYHVLIFFILMLQQAVWTLKEKKIAWLFFRA